MSRVVANGSGGGNGGRKRNEERRIPLPRPPVVTSSSPSDDDDVDENEVQNALKSLASLEDPLPIKRGLSNFYNGKSKSFMNLRGEESKLKMKELEKPDYQMKRKRRLIVEEALSRKISRLSLPVMKSKKDEGISKIKSNGQDESDDQLI
ncbi:uncharacterized protein LOC111386692 [Olea europaea var. sylvestris]|uniref:uncharacterized protein LOC111386692 n=1 Tax=Olea europaea var. sylvestris TaxID=158386 RepID=UPI000C1D37D4|nr:uncharacterized protein LOC111386692 [Olea europaea var. sylvestris]